MNQAGDKKFFKTPYIFAKSLDYLDWGVNWGVRASGQITNYKLQITNYKLQCTNYKWELLQITDYSFLKTDSFRQNLYIV